MATSKEKMEFIFGKIKNAGNVRFRAMFGEYGIYCEEKFVAVVCDEHLFIKITPITETFLDLSHQAEPYPGAKKYVKIPDEKLENTKWLADFLRLTTENLPAKKKK